MDAKQEIANLPGTVRKTLEKGRPEYEDLLRQTRWGGGPTYFLGSGTSWSASLTGVYAFETLPGWPAVARSPAVFATYSMPLLKPGTVVIAVSPSEGGSALLEVARAARARGGSLLAVTNKPESALAKLAGGVLRLRTDSEGSGATVCAQAVMGYLGLIAARIFRKHQPQFEVLEEEFRKLPGQIEWVLTQMSDAVRPFACKLIASKRVYVLGGGFYLPSALQAEKLLQKLGSDARFLDPTEHDDSSLGLLDQDSAVLAVSGSRCRMRKALYPALKPISKSGVKILSITDSNDQELTELSTLALLLPSSTEMIGAVLASVLIHCVACQMAHPSNARTERSRAGDPGGAQNR